MIKHLKQWLGRYNQRYPQFTETLVMDELGETLNYLSDLCYERARAKGFHAVDQELRKAVVDALDTMLSCFRANGFPQDVAELSVSAEVHLFGILNPLVDVGKIAEEHQHLSQVLERLRHPGKTPDFKFSPYFVDFVNRIWEALAENPNVPASYIYYQYLNPVIETLLALQRLALIHSEVSEAVEAVLPCVDGSAAPMSEKLDGVTQEEEELADTLIRIFDYAGRYDLNLGNAVKKKLAYNATWPTLHGKRF